MAKKILIDETDVDEIPDIVENIITLEETDDAESPVDGKAVSAEEQRYMAKQLEGTPHPFDLASVQILKSLCDRGVAADFGVAGYARGHKFREFMRNG
jgi:hypothetical protein